MALPITLAEALSYAAWFHQNLGELWAVGEHASALVKLSTEQSFPFWQAQGTIVQGWALVEQGREEEGVVQIRQGLADSQATGAEVTLLGGLVLLAAVYTKTGQAEEGVKVVAEALARVEKTGGRCWEAELHRLKGELTLQSTSQSLASGVTEAEECFQKALVVARHQGAKSLELRAVMSLSRLWQQQGKKEEAQQLLAEIYGWFTEGFDTKDLQEAKALLEELL
jgi:predicted ATPase